MFWNKKQIDIEKIKKDSEKIGFLNILKTTNQKLNMISG